MGHRTRKDAPGARKTRRPDVDTNQSENRDTAAPERDPILRCGDAAERGVAQALDIVLLQ